MFWPSTDRSRSSDNDVADAGSRTSRRSRTNVRDGLASASTMADAGLGSLTVNSLKKVSVTSSTPGIAPSLSASADALAQWADKQGIPAAKFQEVYNAFGVVTKAKRAHQLQEAFKVQGVPALGIGGRFYTDGSLSGSMERALQITDYLLAEIRKGR